MRVQTNFQYSCARRSFLHELLFGAFWADDVLLVRDEAPADETGAT